jgi:cardiolipin synthase
MQIKRILRLSLAACTSVLFSACAALPDVNYLKDPLPQASMPTVTSAQGTMSRQSSHALLAKRWKNSYVDGKALAQLEELATGRPLIAGNKVTLLYDGPQTMASMIAAIESAKDHINLETYIFD